MEFSGNSAWFKACKIVLMFAASAWLAYSMFSISLRSSWSFVDDQEIAYYLGSDHKIGLWEAWNIYFNETEVGKFGSYQRFRPAYFAFRLLESWLWADNLVLWYLTNLAIYTIFTGLFWYFSSERIGVFISGLITFFMGTAYYWIEIFARLGPSEPYAVLGLTMFGLGVRFLYRPWNLKIGWFMVCTGAMIITGSKENLFLILILLGYIAVDRFRNKKMDLWAWGWLSVTAAWNLWIFSAIILAVGKAGTDVYQQSVSLSQRSLFLLTALKRWEVIGLFVLCVVFLLLGYLTRERQGQISRLSFTLGACLSFLFALYLMQLIIYYAEFPVGNRYDFPGLFVGPLAAVLLIWYFQQITELDRYRSYHALVIVLALVASAVLVHSQQKGIKIAQRESRKHVWETSRNTKNLLRLQSIIAQYPGYTVIFQANTPISDYLVAFTYDPFLRYFGVSNPMSVIWAGGPSEAYEGLEAVFVHDLQTASWHGGAALETVPLKPDFVPLSEADEQKCLLVLISSGEPALDCPVVAYWYEK